MVEPAQSIRRAQRCVVFLVRLFGSFFLLAMIAIAISLVYINDLLANATHANGHVVGINYDAKGRAAAVVRFETANSEIFQLQSQLYTSPGPKVGDTVKVVYRTSNPQDWQIDDWIHLYFYPLLCSIFMFAWGMAATITKLVGDSQIRKLERAGAGSSSTT